jgi:hypothetical protein
MFSDQVLLDATGGVDLAGGDWILVLAAQGSNTDVILHIDNGGSGEVEFAIPAATVVGQAVGNVKFRVAAGDWFTTRKEHKLPYGLYARMGGATAVTDCTIECEY